MISVSRSEFDALKAVGLIRNGSNKNYTITNKGKHGSQKKYYVVEEKQILNFLGRKKEY